MGVYIYIHRGYVHTYIRTYIHIYIHTHVGYVWVYCGKPIAKKKMCGMVFNGPPHVFLVGKLMDFHGYKVSNVKDETLHNLKGIYICIY